MIRRGPSRTALACALMSAMTAALSMASSASSVQDFQWGTPPPGAGTTGLSLQWCYLEGAGTARERLVCMVYGLPVRESWNDACERRGQGAVGTVVLLRANRPYRSFKCAGGVWGSRTILRPGNTWRARGFSCSLTSAGLLRCTNPSGRGFQVLPDGETLRLTPR